MINKSVDQPFFSLYQWILEDETKPIYIHSSLKFKSKRLVHFLDGYETWDIIVLFVFVDRIKIKTQSKEGSGTFNLPRKSKYRKFKRRKGKVGSQSDLTITISKMGNNTIDYFLHWAERWNSIFLSYYLLWTSFDMSARISKIALRQTAEITSGNFLSDSELPFQIQTVTPPEPSCHH